MKNWWLYVLKLEDEKYYIGITSKTPEKRFIEHKNGFMAAGWTNKYKPLEIIQTKNLGEIGQERAKKFENKVTREYIQKHGIENVRGGDITSTGEVFIRFGRFVNEHDWEAITIVLLLAIGLLILSLLVFAET